jgi:hypothetical protein
MVNLPFEPIRAAFLTEAAHEVIRRFDVEHASRADVEGREVQAIREALERFDRAICPVVVAAHQRLSAFRPASFRSALYMQAA